MIKWYLDTDHPVAVDSYDHIDPQIHPAWKSPDKSFNLAFNAKLYQVCHPPISVLDIGCGAGGFVKTILEDGNEAVGLEGSTHPRDRELIGWVTIPDNLFTCDVTYPFVLHNGDHIPHQFDVVTAWEFVEHITEEDLPKVYTNIRAHLKDGGLFILSTPSDITHPPRRGLDHHRTRREAEWWEETISNMGFSRSFEITKHFGGDWVRHGNLRYVFVKLETT